MKKCIACGMPMNNPEDFAMQNPEKDYCKYCSRSDGTMQSYEEKLNSMAHFISETKGLSIQQSKIVAKSEMSKLPAWKNL